MGSSKYPEESGYLDFLTANGGRRNAITSSEYTTYFFTISDKAFPEAVDRLAQMVINPILSTNSMQREREAVDSEYQMNKTSDAARFMSVVSALIRDDHPASFFNIGNLKTLKDEISDADLHAELLKFHKKYVGNNMYVALQSKRTLDEMQEFVATSFASVKNENPENEPRPAPTANVEDIFKPEFFSKIHYMKPKTAKRALVLSWVLPSTFKDYKVSPLAYIIQIFDNNGDGGLANYLREKNLIVSVSMIQQDNTFVSNSEFALVRIAVDLTELGIANIEAVLEAIFSYLLMIKETPIEEHRRFFNELKEKYEVEFKYHTESSPMETVKGFSTDMMIYEDVDIVRADDLFLEFNEKVIVDFIEALNKSKFNIFIFDDQHETFNRKEKYFDTEYDEQDIPAEYLRLWDMRKLNPDFYLEKPNPFKTTNYEIYKKEEESPVS
jgi:secreted Zn-dependent insulinase-like peptidase